MRHDVTFKSGGVDLAAWLYLPGGPGPHPAVIMAHGITCVKEMGLTPFAEAFQRAGFATLVHDHPNFGGSGGEPRLHVDPWAQIAGYRDAVTYLQGRDDVDGARIGVWGTSFSGAHCLVVGAVDRRVKCIVATVPVVSGFATYTRSFGAPDLAKRMAMFAEERAGLASGKPPSYIPVALEGSETYDWIIPAAKGTVWENRQTVLSQDGLWQYEPQGWIERIAPTPLLMILGSHDARGITDAQLAAFARASEPKRLLLLDANHYDTYGPRRAEAIAGSVDWFVEHLITRSPVIADRGGGSADRNVHFQGDTA